jgi:hypothetical protein
MAELDPKSPTAGASTSVQGGADETVFFDALRVWRQAATLKMPDTEKRKASGLRV